MMFGPPDDESPNTAAIAGLGRQAAHQRRIAATVRRHVGAAGREARGHLPGPGACAGTKSAVTTISEPPIGPSSGPWSRATGRATPSGWHIARPPTTTGPGSGKRQWPTPRKRERPMTGGLTAEGGHGAVPLDGCPGGAGPGEGAFGLAAVRGVPARQTRTQPRACRLAARRRSADGAAPCSRSVHPPQ